MPYRFVTPTVKVFPVGPHRLYEFFERLDTGVTVYKTGGTYYDDPFPAQDTLDAADVVYLGGHVHIVTNAVAAELTTAGYGAYLTEIV